MPEQPAFSGLRDALKRKRTRRELFLREMDAVVPRGRLLALTGPLRGALSTACAFGKHRFAATVTLTVTASGVTLPGMGAAHWGLLAGMCSMRWRRCGGAEGNAGRISTVTLCWGRFSNFVLDGWCATIYCENKRGRTHEPGLCLH